MRRLALVIWISLVLAVAPAWGQAAGYPHQGTSLLSLYGDRVSVQYAPGALDRASRIQDRLNQLSVNLGVKARQRWLLLKVRVLSRDDWSREGYSRRFGLPQLLLEGGVALPAWGDEGTVAVWRELLGGWLPFPVEAPLQGAPEEEASLSLADWLSLPELSSQLLRIAGVAGAAPWIEAVMGQAGAVAFVGSFQRTAWLGAGLLPGSPGEYQALFDRLGRLDPLPPAPTLAEFHPDLSLQRYLWYQAQFYEAATLLVAKDGSGVVGDLRKLRNKGKGVVTQAALLQRYPALADWMQRFGN